MSASTPRAEAWPPDDKPLLEVKHRGLLLLGVMLVSICQFFDATIANVALPHMRAALGASPDQISWVLTSFIIAGAITTPITGWLSDRVGSRNLFLGATMMFLLASAACGAATSLPEMIVFRAVQGVAAAFIGPMTQTIMFDVSPPSKIGSTMSGFGMLVMVAPISGPFVGGFLTEYLNWRWIYYVNLPFGIPALILMWWLLPSRPIENRRLDVFGFAFLGLALAALQLMLDRGQEKDWFSSWEIVIEFLVMLGGLWVFLIHSRFTQSPLFNRALYANPPFLVGCAFMTVLGITNISLSAVLPTMYQTIYRYPVMFTGLLMAPRGFGVMLTSMLFPRLPRWIDQRQMICAGYLIASASLWLMTTWSIDMDWHLIVLASFIQGLGLGLVFAPMNLMAFASLPPQHRPDGSSLLGLFRNIGGSFGISVIITLLMRNQQVSHADIASNVRSGAIPGVDLPGLVDRVPALGGGLMEMINAEVSRQAQMIAYLDNFKMIAILLMCIAPLPLFLAKPKPVAGQTQHIAE